MISTGIACGCCVSVPLVTTSAVSDATPDEEPENCHVFRNSVPLF